MKYIITVLFIATLVALKPNTPAQFNNLVSEHKQVQAVTTAANEPMPIEQEQPVIQPQKPTEPETPKAEATVAVQETLPVTTSEGEAKAFIYHKESTTNPAAENHLGCYGLGQDCNGIVKERCGADYKCQDAFFTDYMERRYGSWQKAKAFWLARVPINGRDVGHWW